MTSLDLVVERRGLDPAAETCAHALRDLLLAPVAGVERADLWRFTLALGTDAGAARVRLEAAACRAGRYVNLNRDACSWPSGPRPYPEAAPRRGCAVDVWVQDGDGSDPAALAYFRAQEPSVADLRRGTLWRLWLPDADARAARDRALDLAVTRARRQGLLANPHAQTAEVLCVVPGPDLEESP